MWLLFLSRSGGGCWNNIESDEVVTKFFDLMNMSVAFNKLHWIKAFYSPFCYFLQVLYLLGKSFYLITELDKALCS